MSKRTLFPVDGNLSAALEMAKDAADMNDERLLVPLDDTGHVAAEDCWCAPRLVYIAENGNRVWKHNLKQ